MSYLQMIQRFNIPYNVFLKSQVKFYGHFNFYNVIQLMGFFNCHSAKNSIFSSFVFSPSKWCSLYIFHYMEIIITSKHSYGRLR